MNYFFVSGYVGITPFDVAVSTVNCFPKRSEIVDLLQKHNQNPNKVIVVNIIPLTEEEFNIWTS